MPELEFLPRKRNRVNDFGRIVRRPVPHGKIPIDAGYQTPFAERIRQEAEIVIAAVGMRSGSRRNAARSTSKGGLSVVS